VAAEKPLLCPQCGASVRALSAEEFAFNSQGACRTCSGTGMVMTVDESTLVPDDSLTIDEGAVAPWKSLMWSLMVDICREMGVRTDATPSPPCVLSNFLSRQAKGVAASRSGSFFDVRCFISISRVIPHAVPRALPSVPA
jgi:hypothetical protein